MAGVDPRQAWFWSDFCFLGPKIALNRLDDLGGQLYTGGQWAGSEPLDEIWRRPVSTVLV